jgi:phage terminase large subunit-like protein
VPDLFKTVDKAIKQVESRKVDFDPYYFFEPWDADVPDMETLKAAMEDGVDLEDDPAVKLSGVYPRPFQTGSILSTKNMVCTQAGSRSGKSICTLVVIGAMISRKPPYAFRYDKGEDTGVRRPVTDENITRFGRYHAVTGEFLDHNTKAPLGPEWHCGNIVGCGKFPEELYPPDGEQIWVGTIAKSVDTFWWPALTGEGAKRFLPREFFDEAKGNKGSSRQAMIVHGIRSIDIHIKTYEQKHTKFESQTAWLLAWDEEPPEPSIYISGAVHAKYQRFSFTPLKGRSWSEDLFFSCLKPKAERKKGAGLSRSDFDYFYASQFDSPFVERSKLLRDRRGMETWERKARIWGQYSEYAGQPFFHREKIFFWRKNFCMDFLPVRFRTTTPYDGMYGSSVSNVPGLLQVRAIPERVNEEDGQYVWRMYEKARPGVGYCAVFDAAEGAVTPTDAKDMGFGLVFRAPTDEEAGTWAGLPVVVATIRSSLPTVAFARSAWPVLRHYNNALLAAERGHGKDNEAFGLTLEDWPYWYMYQVKEAARRHMLKKGFDTNKTTRTACLDKIKDWVDEYEVDEDPNFRDDRVYHELGMAVSKQTMGGKMKCDHPSGGSLDGVICLGIATYILQESPDLIVCSSVEEGSSHKGGFMRRVFGEQKQAAGRPSMGQGIGTSRRF